jgi:hypothetical protein
MEGGSDGVATGFPQKERSWFLSGSVAIDEVCRRGLVRLGPGAEAANPRVEEGDDDVDDRAGEHDDD